MLSVFSVVHILNVHACRRAYIHHMQYIASRCNYIYIIHTCLETFEMYVSDVCQVYFFLVYVQCASIVSGWWFGTFFHILGIVIPSDELIFFKMVKTTNQVCNDEFFWVSRGNGVALFLSSLGSGSRLVATSSQATFCWRNPPGVGEILTGEILQALFWLVNSGFHRL